MYKVCVAGGFKTFDLPMGVTKVYSTFAESEDGMVSATIYMQSVLALPTNPRMVASFHTFCRTLAYNVARVIRSAGASQCVRLHENPCFPSKIELERVSYKMYFWRRSNDFFHFSVKLTWPSTLFLNKPHAETQLFGLTENLHFEEGLAISSTFRLTPLGLLKF